MLYMIINKLKNYLSYILILLGLLINLKTIPSVIHKILLNFNVQNTISMDLTNCQTIAFSITANQFFYALFIFACLCILVGYILLIRKQNLNFKYNYFNLSILLCVLVISLYLLSSFVYIYLLILENNLFNKHIIFTIAFVIGCLTNILFLLLYCLIWFDTKLDNKTKFVFLLVLSLFSAHICIDMFSFIYFYGIENIEAGLSSDAFYAGLDYTLTKLGIGIFCMDQNPCQEYLNKMNMKCDHARDVKAIPRVPNGGGTLSTRWITRITNILSTGYKMKTQQKCNDARQDYWKCIDFIRSTNNDK